MMINPEYAKPILELANLCAKNKIPFTLNVIWDGLQMRFPWNGGDFVCHSGSYGHEIGALESMGCDWDGDDVSCAEVEEMFTALKIWYAEVGE